ncbi:MAG: acyl-CoA synthetase FdrA [Anaerolineae bacterium]|nr:acyl-CoA synthetase FdrA [Anaerolineae bacterium]
MTDLQAEVRPGAYYDSVVLMQLQKGLAALPGVVDAGVVMATDANKELLAAMGLLPEGIQAKADDLLIVVQGKNKKATQAALAQVNELLQQRRGGAVQTFRPKSLHTAVTQLPVGQLPSFQITLISVPGRYAANVAEDALNLGQHVFLYSDNVPLADEVRLKQIARAKGLLLMGPDCGTAVINGIGLGFANRVRRGRIGIVAASGTGLQAVSTEIHNLGGGISQAIGVGGRDLKEEVGGITTWQALDLLQRDAETAVIVLVSKPPADRVAATLLRAAQSGDKPVIVNFIGYAPPGRRLGNLFFTSGLVDAAEHAVRLSGEVVALREERRPLGGYLRGLFSGGTLAYEMLLGLQAVLTPLYSNIPIRPHQQLPDLMQSRAHTILDLGEDAFTQGRLHPMMDNDLRLRRLRQETADPDVDMIVLDVVLGEGAHPDPAAELAPAIAEAARADKRVVAIVVGTELDPQDLNSQIERLAAAGAHIFPNVSEALDYVYNRLPPPTRDFPPVSLAAFTGEGLTAVNVGLESFYESVIGQGGGAGNAQAVQVDWRPPAGGNEKLMAILAKMKQGNGQ